MRNFSMYNTNSFLSGSVNEEYPLGPSRCEERFWYPADILPKVLEALCLSMEVTPESLTLAMDEISRQGVLDDADDYENSYTSSLTSAEFRVVAVLWKFFTEATALYSRKTVKDAFRLGKDLEVEVQQSATLTFVHVNMNTGKNVTWLHHVG